MGAGILPTTIHNNKLYFLFGKENKFADTPGWSDFGGGTDNGESFLATSIREAGEELTGFLGTPKDVKKMLTKFGTFNIDLNTYRMHIFPMKYCEALPHYYNNNQQFLQKHLDESVIKNTKIFEKAEIRWICVDDLIHKKKQFRSYFQNMIELMIQQREKILQFITKSLGTEKKYSHNIQQTMGAQMSSSSKKGTRSKTHPGQINYTTKKGDKVFHRKGKYVHLSRKPFTHIGKRTRRKRH